MPEALWMLSSITAASFKSQMCFESGSHMFFEGPVATVFEDPSIDSSDVEINRTGSQQLVIWGTGFSDIVPPAIDFDPPLDSAILHVNVSSWKGFRARVIVLPPTLCKEPVGSPRVFIIPLGFSFLRALFAGAALVHQRRFVFFVEGALMC